MSRNGTASTTGMRGNRAETNLTRAAHRIASRNARRTPHRIAVMPTARTSREPSRRRESPRSPRCRSRRSARRARPGFAKSPRPSGRTTMRYTPVTVGARSSLRVSAAAGAKPRISVGPANTRELKRPRRDERRADVHARVRARCAWSERYAVAAADRDEQSCIDGIDRPTRRRSNRTRATIARRAPLRRAIRVAAPRRHDAASSHEPPRPAPRAESRLPAHAARRSRASDAPPKNRSPRRRDSTRSPRWRSSPRSSSSSHVDDRENRQHDVQQRDDESPTPTPRAARAAAARSAPRMPTSGIANITRYVRP